MAWLLHKCDDIVPIPGTKRVRYLEENVAALAIEITAERMRQLDALLESHDVAGPRYSPKAMQLINR